MSKSLGNVVNPLDLIEQYGIDAVRYYLMKEMVLGQDANFTMESFIKCYNSDLANDFGNLLNRISGLIGKNHAGYIPNMKNYDLTDADKEIQTMATALGAKIKENIANYKVQDAVTAVIEFVRHMNKYMESQAPWKLAKTDLKAAERVLATAAFSLKVSATYLTPVMPLKCAQVLDILSSPDGKIKTHEALFPRIEVEKK